ncbi:MAG: hypothetical protein OEV34_11720 [Gammaproteobacteria bacterium]|nr:hypothetical protein [Gammaproteobacteria bacterium]
MQRLIHTALLGVLLLWGCATPPTLRDVEEIGPDTHLAFGSAEVWIGDEQETWGVKWTGHNNFYLTVLPADSAEAFSYKLDDDGVFFWALEPGEYTVLGYHWQHLQTTRTGQIGSNFVVPESGGDVYVGTFVFKGNEVFLVPMYQDSFEEVAGIYDAKFPGRQGTAIKSLMNPPQPVGSFSNVRGPCDDVWKIECDKHFIGVTPISPEVSQSGFPAEDTLRPEFRWKGCPRSDVSYDLIVYEAASYSIGGALVPLYMRGNVVVYEEDLTDTYWQPKIPLKPDTRFIWSVRLRDGDTVSAWSTQSHSTFLLVYASSGWGQWFQFKTT